MLTPASPRCPRRGAAAGRLRGRTAPATKSERPVQVQRVAFESGDVGPRIRRRGAGALRNRSRLPRRRQDRHAHRQCRRPRARRRRRGAARSAGSAAAGRKRRRRACRRDIEPGAGRRRPRALHHAARARLRSIADFDRKKAAKDEAEGRVERAKRSLELARNQLGYTELKADADGVITATLAEPGQVVAIGQAVARLAHRGEKEAVVALPETLARRGAQGEGDGAALVTTASAALRRPCASCRRRPMPRAAPTRRASPSATPTTRSRSA